MNKEESLRINVEYNKIMDRIMKLYDSGAFPDGQLLVSDVVNLVSEKVSMNYNDVKLEIEQLRFLDDDDRIIGNERRYNAQQRIMKGFPDVKISSLEMLDFVEEMSKKIEDGIKSGQIEADTDNSGESWEQFADEVEEYMQSIINGEEPSGEEEANHGLEETLRIIRDSVSGNSDNSNNSKTARVIVTEKKKEKKESILDEFGVNLNNLAEEGKIDRVIGRKNEIQRVTEILNRRSKNNPVLIGEPGVGKTAIAQGLALKIVAKDVPYKLEDKKVYLLDMGALVAGTQFRGQFEARIKGVIKECKKLGNIILVIDEIHTIVGSGDSENSTNAANILKPALSNGDIQVIGTTTLNEYRKYIEKDSALERRFQPVIVDEPTKEEAIEMIEGIKGYYESYHKVVISKEMVEETVNMSEKYVHDRFLPDKAIDILDEACSKINLGNTKLNKLEMTRRELKKVQKEKEEAIELDSTEDYQKAAEYKQIECKLNEEIEKMEKEIKPLPVTKTDIAKVIERWTKIPVSKITEEETEKLIKLEENLHKRVVGQNSAVEGVAKAIRRNRAGLKTVKRPPSFMFVGPTGVGKTELAKAVAEDMFGSEDNIIRFDMSEYMEKHSVSKLIGSPPGYVGYDEAGQLTEKVRRNPYSIVLFDEIEKAHPDVFNILLQVLDDGRLTDSQGRSINFENTIIIMTSNAGSNIYTNTIGFGDSKTASENKTMEAVKDTFRPEFLNRIDKIVVFDSLTEEELIKIVEIFLKQTQEALDNKSMKLEVTKNAKKHIVQEGTDLKYGARPLRRAVENIVEDELTDLILTKEIQEGDEIVLDYDKKKKKVVVSKK